MRGALTYLQKWPAASDKWRTTSHFPPPTLELTASVGQFQSQTVPNEMPFRPPGNEFVSPNRPSQAQNMLGNTREEQERAQRARL